MIKSVVKSGLLVSSNKFEFAASRSSDVWALTLSSALLVLNIKLLFWGSLLRHWECFKFLLFKYWFTQWASATFCPSRCSLEAECNNSLCWICFFHFLNAFPSFPVGRIGASQNKSCRKRVQRWRHVAQKFNKVTFCTFSTGSRECICCLISGFILTLLNVHPSGSGILCQVALIPGGNLRFQNSRMYDTVTSLIQSDFNMQSWVKQHLLWVVQWRFRVTVMHYSKWFSMNHFKIITHLFKGPMLCCYNTKKIFKPLLTPVYLPSLKIAPLWGHHVPDICSWQLYICRSFSHTIIAERGWESSAWIRTEGWGTSCSYLQTCAGNLFPAHQWLDHFQLDLTL